MGRPRKYSSHELTNHLRQLAAEAHDWTEEDGVITRGEALARLLFRKALGYVERTVDDEGEERVVHHRPESWAIQLIYDRLEGKTPQAVPEDAGRVSAAEQVRELAKQRINALVGSVADESPKPPPHRPKSA